MREEPATDAAVDQYERPNQPWVCGLAAEGCACAAGPTAAGACPALGECTPVQDGDRWRCHRSALRGGECDAGPTPEGRCGCVLRCRPVRSLRSVRGRVVAATALLGAGLIVIALSADWRDAVIAPGPLARAHAQLVARAGEPSNCAACHSAAERSVGGWAAAMVVGRGERPSQSALCMECHDKTMSRELALAAHNVPPDVLQNKKGTEIFFTKKIPVPFSVACSMCHREHHGANFDLTAIDNRACQSCHTRRYHSFASDHPEFGLWPYERRTRIAFDHASHRAKHFAERKQSFECRQCHIEDATQTTELLVGYEAACAQCHDAKIATSVSRGVPMLALPTLDAEALRGAGFDIGPWPADATGDFDGRLPAPMKLLLAADPIAAAAITRLGADFDFLDVDPHDKQQLAACANLAVAIKALLADLDDRGYLAVRERLEILLGRKIDGELAALLAGLSEDTVHGAVAAWLPDHGAGRASSALPHWNASPSLRSPPADFAAPDPRHASYDPAGSWSLDDATLAIRYRPAAHADPVLAGWLTALVATPQLEARPLVLAMLKELSKPTAAGLCTSCHSVEQVAPGQLAVNWHAKSGSTARGFTKFAHGPHLLLPQLADCTHCHVIDASASSAASYADWNPTTFASDFRPLSKQTCANCHTAAGAGDQCQSCHNYHVDLPESWRIEAPIVHSPSPPLPARGREQSTATFKGRD